MPLFHRQAKRWSCRASSATRTGAMASSFATRRGVAPPSQSSSTTPMVRSILRLAASPSTHAAPRSFSARYPTASAAPPLSRRIAISQQRQRRHHLQLSGGPHVIPGSAHLSSNPIQHGWGFLSHTARPRLWPPLHIYRHIRFETLLMPTLQPLLQPPTWYGFRRFMLPCGIQYNLWRRFDVCCPPPPHLKRIRACC